MLRLNNVSVRYGGLSALTEISIEVNAGEFVSIIGPNGAGKTTLFKAISGVVPLAGGQISFEGKDLAEHRCGRTAAPRDRSRSGISSGLRRTFGSREPAAWHHCAEGAVCAGQ